MQARERKSPSAEPRHPSTGDPKSDHGAQRRIGLGGGLFANRPIPESLTIAGHKVAVAAGHHMRFQELMGRAHEVDLVIELNTDLAPSMIGETFLHEVVEMVDKIYGLELPHPAIQTLAAGIYQALTTSVNEAK